jgi:hypothetical protein
MLAGATVGPSDVAALFRSARGLEGQESHTKWEVKTKRNNELETLLNDAITPAELSKT